MNPTKKTINHTDQAIDWAAMTTLLDGNVSLAKKMLTLLRDELIRIKPLINQLLLTKQFDQLITLLHTLRGGSAYCGVTQLQHSCSVLENVLKTDANHDSIPQLVTDLLANIDAVLAAIPTYLETSD